MKPSIKEEYCYSFWMTWGLGHGYVPDLGLIIYLEDCSLDSLSMEPWNYGVHLSHGDFGAITPCCSSKAKENIRVYLKTPVIRWNTGISGSVFSEGCVRAISADCQHMGIQYLAHCLHKF